MATTCFFSRPHLVDRLPAVVVALILALPSAGLGDFSSTARETFVAAVESGHVIQVRRSIKTLIELRGKDHIAPVLDQLGTLPRSIAVYWSLVEGAAAFSDVGALTSLGEFIASNPTQPYARDLVFALAWNDSSYAPFALKIVLNAKNQKLRRMAVREIAKIATPFSVDLLLATFESEAANYDHPARSTVVWEIVGALRELTGQDFGLQPAEWRTWWDKNRRTARLGKVAVNAVYAHPSRTVVHGLRWGRRREFDKLKEAPKEAIVVLSAKFRNKGDRPVKDLNLDHVERVLRRLGVPHTVVIREDFLKHDLSRVGALVINCAQIHPVCICPNCKANMSTLSNRLGRCSGCDRHILFSAQLKEKEVAKIVDFVHRGGYVFAEDWVVKELIEPGFPHTVKTGMVLRKKKISEVDVVPARGQSAHPYLRNVFVTQKLDDNSQDRPGQTVVRYPGTIAPLAHRWVVDDESWAFNVIGRSRVLVLLTSSELRAHTGETGVVVFAFRPDARPSSIGRSLERSLLVPRRRGRTIVKSLATDSGVVLHVLSHFGKQQASRDELLLQNLLLNFLIDANIQREVRLSL